jgi:hypothetical protein
MFIGSTNRRTGNEVTRNAEAQGFSDLRASDITLTHKPIRGISFENLSILFWGSNVLGTDFLPRTIIGCGVK